MTVPLAAPNKVEKVRLQFLSLRQSYRDQILRAVSCPIVVEGTSMVGELHTEDRKSDTWEEYRAEQEAALDRMARQRAARLSAVETLQSKNRA